MNLNEHAEAIGHWRRSWRFRTPTSIHTEAERDMMLGKLCLVHSEISEAAEAVQHYDIKNFEEELADSIIRILDICDSCQIDIDGAVLKKMEANHKRPIKHGKFCSI